ncbi:MAG TPA: filamentous hemagglutinin N-terminal domain-containing protein, partial [Rhodospirillaceae bacterium]|nr:filamentous hemagglutinin N-terminal domain-containing protein [Rhodospirillaceae bacterium]
MTFSATAGKLTVTETTRTAIINWQGFSVAAGEVVQFVQPSAGAGILNRVTGSSVSRIDGLVQANGRLMLLNPNGTIIGAGGGISAASLLLTSSALADADYLAGRYAFTGVPGQGNIVNHGRLEAADGGSVVVSAPQVVNDGVIQARLGTVAVGGAAGFTLDPTGDGLWTYQISEPAAAALVANAGTIAADGGKVLISVRSLDGVMRDVINTSGMIEARSIAEHDGEIVLDGGNTGGVTLASTSVIDASGGTGARIAVSGAVTHVDGSLLAPGGSVETSGETLTFGGQAAVKASTWLLDPTDFVIDGTNNTTIQNSLNGGSNVTIQTTAGAPTVTGSGAANGSSPGANGDIVVSAALSWSTNKTLTLDSYKGVQINAAVTASGNTAGIVITTNDGGTGGQLLTGSGGKVTLSGTTPTLSIDSTSYTLLATANDLQNSLGTAGHYALANDIDLTSIGSFQPIGYNAAAANAAPTAFSATLEGLGHAVTNFKITTLTTANNLGMISSLTGTLRDFTLSGAGVTAGTGLSNFGMVAGKASGGTITNVGASGPVAGGSGSYQLGGLVGSQDGGTIASSYATGSVSGSSGSHNNGGLVGYLGGGATISASYATGSVSGSSGNYHLGGLVGYVFTNGGIITDSHATGSVGTPGGGNSLGGLVGQPDAGTISASYATGTVTSGTKGYNLGGLVGSNAGGTVQASFATGSVSAGDGGTEVGGLVGFNTTVVLGSFATGPVTIGDAIPNGTINGRVGGLAGVNNGSIFQSYATGPVTVGASNGATNDRIGGFVGRNAGTVSASYATGLVTSGSGTTNVGGLVGSNGGSVLASYWD